MKRKELYCNVQEARNIAHPRQLLLNMKVRRSSTSVMMEHASEDTKVRGIFCCQWTSHTHDGRSSLTALCSKWHMKRRTPRGTPRSSQSCSVSSSPKRGGFLCSAPGSPCSYLSVSRICTDRTLSSARTNANGRFHQWMSLVCIRNSGSRQLARCMVNADRKAALCVGAVIPW